MNRFDVTWFVVKPINGVTYFPSLLEMALIIGVASGVLLVYTLVSHYFPIFAETMPIKKSPEPELPNFHPARSTAGN